MIHTKTVRDSRVQVCKVDAKGRRDGGGIMGGYSGNDWNGDGKNDFLDDLFDLELLDSGLNDRGSGSGGGGCGLWLFIIIGFILLFVGC